MDGAAEPAPIVVFKVGGSLLDLDDLAARSRELLQQIPDCRPLFVVGGGPAADVVRSWHQKHHLSEEQSHWLAIRSLTVTAALFSELWPETTIVNTRDAAEEAWKRGRVAVLDPYPFISREEGTGRPTLTHCWDTTTDSIAAWTAAVWPARMLVLAKSVDLPVGVDCQQAVQLGLVDQALVSLAPFVARIGWINLRSPYPILSTWCAPAVEAE